MLPASFNTPPLWSNQPLILYHGTLQQHKASLASGIMPSMGRSNTDFGIGFYTTTLLDQAKSWAWQAAQVDIARGNLKARGCVLAYTLDRDLAAPLESLSFVRGDREAEDFWSLVFHCRQGLAGHGRSGPNSFYDLVSGPVAAFWQQRIAMADADQISIHSAAAACLLKPEPSLNIDL
jgi:hypothetical protein